MRKLEVVSPVCADIDIVNSMEPLHIAEITKQLDLTPDHYNLYGKYKAKRVKSPIFCIRHREAYLLDEIQGRSKLCLTKETAKGLRALKRQRNNTRRGLGPGSEVRHSDHALANGGS